MSFYDELDESNDCDSRILIKSSLSLSLIFNILSLFFNLPGFCLQSLLK